MARIRGAFLIWFLYVCLFWFSNLRSGAGDPAFPPRTIAEIRGLDPKAANPSEAVLVKAIVTYYDSTTGVLIVQDETGGIAVQGTAKHLDLRAGNQVEIKGVSQIGPFQRVIGKPRITVLGSGVVPPPLKVDEEVLASGTQDCHWVEYETTVRAVSERLGKTILATVSDRRRIEALVLNSSPEELNADLVGARVTIRGVCAVTSGKSNEVTIVQLLVPGFEDVKTSQEAPDPVTLPIRSIAEINAAPADARATLVRTKGTVIGRTSYGYLIDDKTGQIEVQGVTDHATRPGMILDATGFRSTRTPIVLEDALIKRVGLTLDLARKPKHDDQLPRLLTVAEARNLPLDECRKGYPVRLHGIITYVDNDWTMVFFQGATEGIYVQCSEQRLDLTPGNIVVLRGYTAPGDYAPVIIAPEFEIQGQAPPPPAHQVKYEDLISGRHDSQWVEIEGTIGSMTNDNNHLSLDILSKSGKLQAIIPHFRGKPLPGKLVGARVKLTGVCGTLFNQNRQFLGAQLFIPSLSDVSPEPDAKDPFSDPPQPVKTLLNFGYREAQESSVHVRGTVLLRKSGILYLQDETAGVAVRGTGQELIPAGTIVDAVGIPSVGEYTPVLQYGRIRKVSKGNLPKPLLITAEKALSHAIGDPVCDARWVEIDARVLDYSQNPTDEILFLQNGQTIFAAHLEKTDRTRPLSAIKRQSLIRLTGVCVVQVDESRWPRAFRILLPSAGNITVLENPSWWTVQRSLRVAGGMGLGGLLAGFWVVTLQRRVRKQTSLIESKLQREAALEERFRTLVEQAADAIFVHDSDGRILNVNQCACQSLGYTRSQLLALTMSDIEVNSETRSLRENWSELPARKAANITGAYRRKDGSTFPVEIRLGPFIADNQHLFLALVRDVTERRNLEGQLAQAQKMESIGRLAGGVAHDFNNILTVVQGHCSLLTSESELSEFAQESVGQISEAADRAARLTSQMLMLSRKQVMEQKVQDLKLIIEEMTKMLKRIVGEDITVSVRSDSASAIVKADRGMMEQIILNLAVNSRDAMPKGGKIEISIEHLSIDATYLQQHPEGAIGKMIRLRFKDHGCGISPENIPRIFEPFFTTKEVGRGTGLGLATVYGIVKQHGGWIEVVSKEGEGTTFDIFLPEALHASSEGESEGLVENRRGHENILLVEDESSLRELVKKILVRDGYQVTEAGSGPEALAIWPQLRNIDLLVTDLVMPGGMSGLELADNLRRLRPNLKVLFTSGYSADVAGKDFPLEDGVNFLPKPFGPRKLAEIVRSCLDARSPL